jgi:hypothetical protein
MKFTSSFLVSVILATCVSSLPLSKRSMNMGGSKGFAAGAAYFITNEPTGNFIVAADIGSDGKLSLRQATPTGGLGAHGLSADGSVGPDPLFSQGAIKASSASNMLAAVNPGSNTISLFKIDPNDPTAITPLGGPIGTGGDFPMSLAFNKAGDTVCALNGGSVNGVNCFAVDSKLGLMPLPDTNRLLNISQTTPATGPAGTVSHVIFDEDNKKLIAAVKGVPDISPGFLAVWDVASATKGSAGGMTLSKDFQQVEPATGGLLPFSMTIVPGKNALLTTDAAIGFDVFDFASSTANGTSAKDSANAIDGQGATCWSSFSPKTRNFYVTDIVTSMVTEVNLDNNLKPTIVNQYAQGNDSSTIDNEVASIGGNDFLYVLSPGSTSINVLSLNGPKDATQLQNLEFSQAAKSVGLTVDTNNLQGMTTFVRK